MMMTSDTIHHTWYDTRGALHEAQKSTCGIRLIPSINSGLAVGVALALYVSVPTREAGVRPSSVRTYVQVLHTRSYAVSGSWFCRNE